MYLHIFFFFLPTTHASSSIGGENKIKKEIGMQKPKMPPEMAAAKYMKAALLHLRNNNPANPTDNRLLFPDRCSHFHHPLTPSSLNGIDGGASNVCACIGVAAWEGDSFRGQCTAASARPGQGFGDGALRYQAASASRRGCRDCWARSAACLAHSRYYCARAGAGNG